MTELSSEYTYFLRYDNESGGPMCATRTGIGSRIELQPLVPELIDVQGWIPEHLNGSTYRIVDPTAYGDSKEYGISEPVETGPPNAVSLGGPSEFNFTAGRGEPTKYSIELKGASGFRKCLGIVNNQLVIARRSYMLPWKDLPHWYLDRVQ